MNRFEGEVLDDVMTSDDWAHVDRVDTAQSDLLRAKYSAGKSVHGGACWLKPGMLSHALDEHADQGVYLHTLREQMLTLARKCRQHDTTLDAAADEIERWSTK